MATAEGQTDPSGSDAWGNGYVIVSYQRTRRFSGSISFASLEYSSIDSLALTLTFSRSGPSFIPGGSQSAYRGPFQRRSRMTFSSFWPTHSRPRPTLNLFTDFLSGNSFAHSLAAKSLSFWFAEGSRLVATIRSWAVKHR